MPPVIDGLLTGTAERQAILEMLAMKVTATTDRVDVAGVIPLEPVQPAGAAPTLLTIGQTSACLLCCTYEYPSLEPVVTVMSQPKTTDSKQYTGLAASNG